MSKDTRICFKCEWENPLHARFCEFCNASLPVITREEETSRFDFVEQTVYRKIVDVGWYSPKFKQLLAAGEGLLEGTMSKKRFKDIINVLHGDIIEELYGDEGVRESLKVYVREENSDRADDIMEMCIDALYDYDEAYDEIKLYFEDNQTHHIRKGMEMALDAKNRMIDALDLLDSDDNEYRSKRIKLI